MIRCSDQIKVARVVCHRWLILFCFRRWCIGIGLGLTCLSSAFWALSLRSMWWNFPIVLHMILVARGLAGFSRFIFVVTLISRLLLANLGSLSRSWPHTLRISFVSNWGSWARWIISFLSLLWRELKLLLAFCCLILFIHEVDIVFLLMVECRFKLLLAAQIILRVSTCTLARGILVCKVCRTASLATYHSFEILESYHDYCYIV